MIGLVDRERVDAALYDDYETEKAREVCLILLLLLWFLYSDILVWIKLYGWVALYELLIL